jgi:hypothetical protein
MIKVASCETTNLYRNFKDRNMANNTDALYKPLKTAKNDLLKVIDELDALGDLAVSFGGDIARVLPSQLKASTDAIMGLISGPNQNSIDSLTEYLDNVPLGAIKSHTAEDRLSGDSGTAPAPTPQIDTTPHTENGPQTAVHEDIDLSQFYKQNFVQPVKEKSFTEPDWNRIKESSDFTDIDLGEKMCWRLYYGLLELWKFVTRVALHVMVTWDFMMLPINSFYYLGITMKNYQ